MVSSVESMVHRGISLRKRLCGICDSLALFCAMLDGQRYSFALCLNGLNNFRWRPGVSPPNSLDLAIAIVSEKTSFSHCSSRTAGDRHGHSGRRRFRSAGAEQSSWLRRPDLDCGGDRMGMGTRAEIISERREKRTFLVRRGMR
jgi:hypothetical protein